MRNTLVAVNAGLFVALCQFVRLDRTLFLFLDIHALKTMAVAAFSRVRALHPLPLEFGERQPFCLKFLRSIYGARDLAIELECRQGLAGYFVHPVLGNMAIRAHRPYTGTVRVVNSLLVFLINRVTHLVAGNAEL